MNGDGLADLVRIRKGDVRYWPGRGNGLWGTGNLDDCPGGGFGPDRSVAMEDGPQYADPDGTELRIDDINGDGLDDLVQVRFNAIDVWLNSSSPRRHEGEKLTEMVRKNVIKYRDELKARLEKEKAKPLGK